MLNLDAALDEIEDIQKEIAVLALCRCPSIVGFHRAFVRGPKLWIVMDLMVGSALDLVRPVAGRVRWTSSRRADPGRHHGRGRACPDAAQEGGAV